MYIDYQWLVDNGYLQTSSDHNPDIINGYILELQKTFERITGRIFEEYSISRVFDGGMSRLYFDNPVISVEELRIGTNNIPVINNSDYVSNISVEGSVFTATVVNLPKPKYDKDIFYIQFKDDIPYGEAAGYISVKSGYLEENDTPKSIKHAIAKLTALRVSDPVSYENARNKRGVTMEVTDGHSYMLDSKAAKSSIFGDSEVDDILVLYSKRRRRFHAGLA